MIGVREHRVLLARSWRRHRNACGQSFARFGGVKGAEQAARDNLSQSGASSPGYFLSLSITGLSACDFIHCITSDGGPSFDPKTMAC
jgi:hypothetical protein